MGAKGFLLMLLSGLCVLPSCFPRQYHLVKENKTWTEAQSYCRQKYTDLATLDSQEDVAKLSDVLGRHHTDHVWIGLRNDNNSWRWSLENESYYGEGEAEFRGWQNGQPDDLCNAENCVASLKAGSGEGWRDVRCKETYSFICYNAKGSPRFKLVEDKKTWTEARSYCRENYADLVSVRNQSENQEILTLGSSHSPVFIGLLRGVWKWSDGSTMLFPNWETSDEPEPDKANKEPCVGTTSGKWQTWSCSEMFYFLCHEDDEPTPQWTWKKLCCGCI